MRVIVADDEPLARALLATLLRDAQIDVIGEARDGPQAVRLARELEPDAIFLDIDMPGGGGVLAAQSLQASSEIQVIFVTAHESHAVDAFDLGAVDYVLKPVRRARLAQALDRIRARLADRLTAMADRSTASEGHFWVRTARGIVHLPIGDIVWIEAARDYVYFHTAKASYMHRVKMAELEIILQNSGLVRVRRSAFVRLDRVTSIVRRGKAVSLELGASARVGVGSTYEDRVLGLLDAAGARRRR